MGYNIRIPNMYIICNDKSEVGLVQRLGKEWKEG
jgi:hypothetical protein